MTSKEAETLVGYIRGSGLTIDEVMKAISEYQKKQAQELRKQMPLPLTGIRAKHSCT